MSLILSGTYPALVTPFTQSGDEIDWLSFETLIEYCLLDDVSGLVVAGSTGEAVSLSDDEYRTLIKRALEVVKDRVQVIAGIGAGSTSRAKDMARYLSDVHADAALVVVPPYIKPTQNGIVEHFRAIHGVTELPLIAYNVPCRTGTNMLPATTSALANEGLIVGIKESSRSADQLMDIYSLTEGKLAVLAGDDALIHVTMACGGVGAISVTANLVPTGVIRITDAGAAGDFCSSLEHQSALLPIIRALFSESNPIPVKTALCKRGVIKYPSVRLPLTPATEDTIRAVDSILPIVGSFLKELE